MVAFYDANVLYPAGLRGLLMHLAAEDLVQPKWTDRVHEEWISNLLRKRPDLTRAQLQRTRELMDLHAEDALVRGYEHLISGLRLPDANDRHVLAAAIHANASVIVTCNVRDFPPRVLAPSGIRAIHPDAFVCDLIATSAEGVILAAERHRASLRSPPRSAQEYVETIALQGLHQTAAFLQHHAARAKRSYHCA